MGDDARLRAQRRPRPGAVHEWITACGLEDAAFTTIARELGRPVDGRRGAARRARGARGGLRARARGAAGRGRRTASGRSPCTRQLAAPLGDSPRRFAVGVDDELRRRRSWSEASDAVFLKHKALLDARATWLACGQGELVSSTRRSERRGLLAALARHDLGGVTLATLYTAAATSPQTRRRLTHVIEQGWRSCSEPWCSTLGSSGAAAADDNSLRHHPGQWRPARERAGEVRVRDPLQAGRSGSHRHRARSTTSGDADAFDSTSISSLATHRRRRHRRAGAASPNGLPVSFTLTIHRQAATRSRSSSPTATRATWTPKTGRVEIHARLQASLRRRGRRRRRLISRAESAGRRARASRLRPWKRRFPSPSGPAAPSG